MNCTMTSHPIARQRAHISRSKITLKRNRSNWKDTIPIHTHKEHTHKRRRLQMLSECIKCDIHCSFPALFRQCEDQTHRWRRWTTEHIAVATCRRDASNSTLPSPSPVSFNGERLIYYRFMHWALGWMTTTTRTPSTNTIRMKPVQWLGHSSHFVSSSGSWHVWSHTYIECVLKIICWFARSQREKSCATQTSKCDNLLGIWRWPVNAFCSSAGCLFVVLVRAWYVSVLNGGLELFGSIVSTPNESGYIYAADSHSKWMAAAASYMLAEIVTIIICKYYYHFELI